MSFDRYKLDKDKIRKDLTEDLPRYILSAYGPEKELPIQLFGGYPREQSFEELRLRHYELAFQGNQQQAIQEAQSWFTSAQQQIQTALNDLEGAIKYMINGENEHPNRIDVCQGKGAASTQTQGQGPFQQATSAFGQSTSNPGFGKPSSLGQPQSTTSQVPAFGQPTQFGRPSSNISQPASSFGSSTALGRPFGQSVNPTSAFGQPTTTASSFGQPSALTAFGQGSPFGQQSVAPSVPGLPSSLGSNQQTVSGFQKSTNVFGQPSAPAQTGSFGQPSKGFANPFGQQLAPSTSSPFGQSTSVVANPFAKPAAVQAPGPFSQPSNSSSTSGQQPPQSSNVFGQPSNAPGKGSSQPAITAINPVANLQPRTQSQTAHATFAGDRLKTWKGKTVTYVENVPFTKAQNGELEKIHFPNGRPSLTKSPELPDDVYDEATKENYKFMMDHGSFKDGIMPNLPPKREWCKWDF